MARGIRKMGRVRERVPRRGTGRGWGRIVPITPNVVAIRLSKCRIWLGQIQHCSIDFTTLITNVIS